MLCQQNKYLIYYLIKLIYKTMGEIISSQKKYISVWNNQLCRKPKDGEKSETKSYTNDKGEVKTKTAVFLGGYSGIISNMEIKQNDIEGNKFETLELSFNENGESVILSLGEKLMLAFLAIAPNVDYSTEIKLVPYKDIKGKLKLSAKQGSKLDLHVENYYHDFNTNKDRNGLELIQKPDVKTADLEDWKIYFIQIKKTLKRDFVNIVLPKLQKIAKSKSGEVNFQTSTINEAGEFIPIIKSNDDLPF